MNKIIEYLYFFSKWHVIFDVVEIEYPFGKEPESDDDAYEFCVWFCKTINSKPTSEIDKILKDFDAEIDKLHEAVHSKKYKSGSVVSRADIILALEKAKILYNRIQPVATGNSNPISETVEHYWHFTGNDIVFQSQNRFDDYQIQTGRRWEQLLLSSKESLTYYIFPFKASLEKLIPLFKIILDIKEPPQKASRKKVTTPNNFVGPYFQSDVVNLLYREFVGLGYIIDTKEQKDSFYKIFRRTRYQKKIYPKVNWLKGQTNLRYFIHLLDEIFPMPDTGNEQKWKIADNNFTATGKTIELSVGKANGHYGTKGAMEATYAILQKAYLCYESSDS